MKEPLVSQARERKPPKVLEDIRLQKAENGGVIATHHFTSYEHKPEPHVFGADEGKQFLNHISEHMLSKPEAEDETGGGIADQKGGGAEADREMA